MPKVKAKIIVCYLRSGSDVLDDHILNRMAAWVAPAPEAGCDPVVHVELFFPETNSELTGLSAGIHYGGQMFMHPKTFSRKDWVFHSIMATPRQVQLAKAFCERQRGANFNYLGFYSPQPCNIGHAYRLRNMDTQRMPWFCSELVAYTLLHAGLLTHTDAKAASKHPQMAYNVIQNTCNTYMDSARSLKGRILSL